MARSSRFRNLELDPDARKKEGPAVVPANTDVCRRCGAEHPEGRSQCPDCGGPLGGPGQEAFDRAFHARRAAAEDEAVRAQVGAPVDPNALAEALRALPLEREGTGYGSFLGASAIAACIFALVSIPVRLAFAAAYGGGAPWRAVAELLLVVGLTVLVRQWFAPALRRL